MAAPADCAFHVNRERHPSFPGQREACWHAMSAESRIWGIALRRQHHPSMAYDFRCRPARVRSPPILDGRPNPRAVQTPWQCGGANELDGTSAVNATRSRAVSWLQKRATASAHCSRKSTYNSMQSYSPLNRAQGQADACHDCIPGALLLLRIHEVKTVYCPASPRKVATAV